MNLKGSKTEKNLMTAFAGESQARNKYTYYAGKAKKEGFEQIAAIFQETADNEKEHVKITNGPTCMRLSQKRRKKRVLIRLPSCLNRSQRSKKSTKNATKRC